MSRTKPADSDIQLVRENYRTMMNRELAVLIGKSTSAIRKILKKYELKRTEEEKASLFVRGTEASRFKSGEINHIKKIGSIETRKARGRKVKYIKVADNKWMIYTHYVFCVENGQEIPDGYILRLKDGNNKNIVYENLELITRAENFNKNKKKSGQKPKPEKPLQPKPQNNVQNVSAKPSTRSRTVAPTPENLDKIYNTIAKPTIRNGESTEGQIPLRINATTIVFINPWEKPDEVREKYAYLNI